ncbi:MAG: sporulation transcriptional regulator SpoIIID [Bacilli bacterium]|nr:sporulation transcriptional regulator SpoIIID [Bacilli bacterium]
MSTNIIKRVISEGNYMVESKKTIREIAKIFGVSKSTVHKDLQDRLISVDDTLYKKVNAILKDHINTRHIKGGQSTRKKYLKT